MRAPSPSSPTQLIHDSKFYIAEGNTVLRVEDTLFKVHRYLLSRDGSAFEDMFSLDAIPSHSVVREGDSDENPIVLHGDKPEEFRALLWSLYALPAEVFQMPSTQSEVVRFIHLARIAHKYSYRTTENWALHVLTVCQTNSDIVPPPPVLTQLTEVAVLCNHEELHEAVEPMWADLLFTGQTEDIISAMTVADKLNLRPLLGLAYYLMMLKGREEWNASTLTKTQKIRLVSGYYNISRACEALPMTAPTLVHHPTCFMNPKCGEAWQTLWTTMVYKMMGDSGARVPMVDLLRKLHLANHLLEKLLNGESPMEVPSNMNKNCLRNGLQASEETVNDVLYGLADCFVDIE
ncbi:hypothetical protein V5O48_008703 [Marasmius crinis-equi]|uniref:BTB domain-containing protein n=1 Tax=Marasmius crinis-equi TaxID=585013 RepID=A0ABR3FD72_9AGAR